MTPAQPRASLRNRVALGRGCGSVPIMAAQDTRGGDRRPLARLDDDALLQAGEQALLERLGAAGMVRFLRLVAPGRESFEDIRRDWEGQPMTEILAGLGVKERQAG